MFFRNRDVVKESCHYYASLERSRFLFSKVLDDDKSAEMYVRLTTVSEVLACQYVPYLRGFLDKVETA